MENRHRPEPEAKAPSGGEGTVLSGEAAKDHPGSAGLLIPIANYCLETYGL